jgi:hypothetical protein
MTMAWVDPRTQAYPPSSDNIAGTRMTRVCWSNLSRLITITYHGGAVCPYTYTGERR